MSKHLDIHNNHAMRSPCRVLIVDDEPNVLAVARAILEAHGFDVATASSGDNVDQMVRDAIRRNQRYSAIVLDLTMPGGPSGFEVLETILKTDPLAAVIACSAYFQEDATELCNAIGFVDVLQKPYTVERLCSAVRRCLNRGHTARVTPVDIKSN